MFNKLFKMLKAIINKLTFLEYRRTKRREKRAQKSKKIASKIYKPEKPFKVISGPFAGMEYPKLVSSSSELLPKLIGSYEKEAHNFIERLIESNINRVINIGAGEGYYAVGMAMRNKNAEVYAFDPDQEARNRCRSTAELNNVSERVKIFDICSFKQLKELTQSKSNIICDCDGCEYSIFGPKKNKYFQNCNILLELHERENTIGIENLLKSFEETHKTSLVEYSERNPHNYSIISDLQYSEQKFALDENRSTGFRWALLESRLNSLPSQNE